MSTLHTYTVAAALAASIGLCATAFAQDTSPARHTDVVVLPFAVAGQGRTVEESLSFRACAASGSAPAKTQDSDSLKAAAEGELPAQLKSALLRELEEKGLHIDEQAKLAPPESLIVAGCIRQADPGDAAQRLLGMNMGASVLSAHVQLYRSSSTSAQLVSEFDAQATGVNKLPPIGPVGLAVRAIKADNETLAADAGKLAKLIAERVATVN